MYKGQAVVEFLTSIILFLLVLTSAITIMSDKIPDFKEDLENSGRNMEIYSVTEEIMSNSGYHSNSGGGSNWENNIQYTEEFGLAEDYLALEKDKIESISTTGENKFNYTQFRNINDLEHQYHFNFTWFPIIETSNSFIKNSSAPKITEPDDTSYTQAENTVHYGTFQIDNRNYRFLITAHGGVYDSARVSESNWDFSGTDPLLRGDKVEMSGSNFTIKNFQNRARKPGTSLIFENHIKSFGPAPNSAQTSTMKLNRYGTLKASNTDEHVVRIEVLAW